ncbi:MAG: hypothetical protein BWX64_02476 [Acidobacteria bacterium ADurb.Bin051]|nr:MAG: hypothetical protein BWX64_02476 [Acidobacteria bacterium ADurb.Bin051]
MAKQVLKNLGLYYGSLALASQVNQVALEATAPEVDVSTFDTGGYAEVLAGLLKASVKFDGFWDAAEPDASAFDQMSKADWPATVVKPAGTAPAVGDVAYFLLASEFSYTLGAQVGAAARLSLGLTGAGALLRGQVLDAQAPATASGNGAGVELGAVTAAQRLYYAVHVVGKDGTSPTLDLVVQSEEDNAWATPTARVTVPQFSDVGSAYGSIAGPITDTWFRVVRTLGGTDPEWTYLVALAIR